MCVSFLRLAVIFLFSVSPTWAGGPAVTSQGTVFIREKVKDTKVFRDLLRGQLINLKSHGFSAYSLHQDLMDPQTFILTLKCSNVKKGVDFIRSPEYMAVFDRAGARIPMIWYGADVAERKYTDRSKMTGGIVIARNEVRDFGFWKTCFYKEDGGKHNHPGRKYKNSNYSIHYLAGKPEVAIVVHEASDVSKAPDFMISDPMVGEMEATGVIGLEIWYGKNLEERTF